MMASNMGLAINVVLMVVIVIGLANIVRMEIPMTAAPAHTGASDNRVMLFVMAFCPYGQQAEKAMKPVVDLLGDKVGIVPHFIVSVQGTTVNSLHGPTEAQEDMRQACIWKYYDQKTYWNYVSSFDNSCTLSNAATCWKTAASSAGIDTTKIETCATNEGVTLMLAEQNLTDKYSVSGSPTLIIDGQQSNADRTPEGYKAAVCAIISPTPSACGQTLNSTGATASGGCS